MTSSVSGDQMKAVEGGVRAAGARVKTGGSERRCWESTGAGPVVSCALLEGYAAAGALPERVRGRRTRS
jgi:hypothetical protein